MGQLKAFSKSKQTDHENAHPDRHIPNRADILHFTKCRKHGRIYSVVGGHAKEDADKHKECIHRKLHDDVVKCKSGDPACPAHAWRGAHMVPTDGTSGSSHASGKQILSDDEQSPLPAEQDCGGDACTESSPTLNKKAVIIGINYAGNKRLTQLSGCHNDAFNMKQCLVKCRGFLEEHITLLIDDGNEATPQSNRQTIIQELRNLVQDAQSDDWLFLHFSGHGGQLPAVQQDEIDGKDEDILPSDYDAVQPIRDNELNDILVKDLPKGCLLTCVFDSCHSESIMDLPLVYNGDNYLHSEVTEAFREAKGSLGHVACFSACVDEGTSQEIQKGEVDVGACTDALIQVMETHLHCTCVQCVQEVNMIMKKEKLTQTAQVSVVDRRDIRQDIFFGRARPVVSSTHTM